jgi:hypothetical protein
MSVFVLGGSFVCSGQSEDRIAMAAHDLRGCGQEAV